MFEEQYECIESLNNKKLLSEDEQRILFKRDRKNKICFSRLL